MAVANNDDNSNSDHLAIQVEDDDEKKKVQRIIEYLAKNTAGAGTVSSNGAGAINTAGAGSVAISGGTGGGSVNTSGAGSVTTYTGVSDAADNDEEEEDCANKIPWAVGVLGGLADGAVIGAAVYKSPRGAVAHGGEVAYRVGLLIVLAAGLVEMVAAVWVAVTRRGADPQGRKCSTWPSARSCSPWCSTGSPSCSRSDPWINSIFAGACICGVEN